MPDLVLYTYDWVPEPPRGFVRDLRIRWALEEAGLPYRVASTPFNDRGPEHLAHQPFNQTPWLMDGDISIFETGAILLHLGELSDTLMPADARGRAAVQEWVVAALNSVEMAVLPWWFSKITDGGGEGPLAERLAGFLKLRLTRLEAVLQDRAWLAGGFSIADILMADVLRLADKHGGLEGFPACKAYLQRAIERPAFVKAHADQLAHFASADAARA